MPVKTKERILVAGAELFGRQGYTGTGVKQIVEAADAPFGSLYHHFPGGKEQIGEQAIRRAGVMYAHLGPEVFDPAPDVVSGVEAFFAGAAQTLVDTSYEDACPIATIALEVASTNESLRQATADVFSLWIDGLVPRFVAAGISAERSRELAVGMIAALEGAFVLARAGRSVEPLFVAGALVAGAVRDALPS